MITSGSTRLTASSAATVRAVCVNFLVILPSKEVVMRGFIVAILFILTAVGSAIMHERDIYRNLKLHGHALSAAWTCEIYSAEMKDVSK